MRHGRARSGLARVARCVARWRAGVVDARQARRLNRLTDTLPRLDAALPSVSRWIDDLLEAHENRSTLASELDFTGLSVCFPTPLLVSTKVVVVRDVPFPPMSALGVREFDDLARMPKAGITFRGMYFVAESASFEHIHFHELVHAIQWRTLGFDDFLLTYAVNLLLYGYARNPLESLAFDLEAEFMRGARSPGIAEVVTDAALRARESAVVACGACGLEFKG
jgi:hypothetical protein